MKKNLVGIKKVCIFAANKNNKELGRRQDKYRHDHNENKHYNQR